MLHAPKQSRSRKTLERILSAARSLMASEGVDEVGITQIVAEAKSSVGSFYARFDGKEDLIRHLHERLWDEAGARWRQGMDTWSGEGTPESRGEGLVDLIRGSVEPDYGLRASLGRVLGQDGTDARQEFDAQVVRDGSRLFDGDAAIRHPSPSEGISVGVRLSLSALRDQLGSRGLNGGAEDGFDLAAELVTVLRGYWGVGKVVQAAGPTDDTAIEYFDIWG